jgi:hypothetical protein
MEYKPKQIINAQHSIYAIKQVIQQIKDTDNVMFKVDENRILNYLDVIESELKKLKQENQNLIELCTESGDIGQRVNKLRFSAFNEMYLCSGCHSTFSDDCNSFSYCPYCGKEFECGNCEI